jgi:type IV secretory pathway VirB10-like protein
MFHHDPDPLGGRFFNSKLFWVAIVALAAFIVWAMLGIYNRRATANVTRTHETKAVATPLPADLGGADSHLKLAQRKKDPPPPDLSNEVARLNQKLSDMEAELARRNETPTTTTTTTPTPAPDKLKPEVKKVDPDAQRRKQQAEEARRQAAQELKEARKSPLSAIRHDKQEDRPQWGLTHGARWAVNAGTILPLVMYNSLNSDTPNDFIAYVASDVTDSLTHETIVIPQGSVVTGTYSSAVFGQERISPVANLLTLPNGDMLKLDGFHVATPSGQAGLDGDVDQHWGRILASIPLSVLRAGARATTALGSGVGARIAGTVAQDAAQETTQAAKQSFLTVPTITTDRAKIAVILLPKPLELRPYREKRP